MSQSRDEIAEQIIEQAGSIGPGRVTEIRKLVLAARKAGPLKSTAGSDGARHGQPPGGELPVERRATSGPAASGSQQPCGRIDGPSTPAEASSHASGTAPGKPPGSGFSAEERERVLAIVREYASDVIRAMEELLPGVKQLSDEHADLRERIKRLELELAVLVEGTVEFTDAPRIRTLAQRVGKLELAADWSRKCSCPPDEDGAHRWGCAFSEEGAPGASATTNTGEDRPTQPQRDRLETSGVVSGPSVVNVSSPASPASEVPSWVPSADEIVELLQSDRALGEPDDYVRADKLRRLIAKRAPRPWGAFSAEQRDAAAEALAKDFGHSFKLDSQKMRFVSAVNVVLRALGEPEPRPAPQPSVEEMAEARYKALSDAARVCDEIAQLMAVKANDANAQRKNEDEDEFDARADTAKHLGMKIRALAKAALSALPAPDEKLGTLPPFKTLNECREVFRRVAKRGPCLSSPDLHGIAAVRDFLTLDEEAFRRNWGPRDEDDDEKCEGGECRHGFDAGGGERLTECEKHGGKPAPAPQPEREALGEPSERIAKFLDALEKRLDVDDDDAWMLSRSDIDYLRACLAHRAPATSSSATDSTERGWLIERNDKPSPLWWCGHSSRGMEWTPNSLEAIRFARKVDADMVNVTMLASCGVTTEHYWVAPWSPGRNVQNETAPAPSPALAAIVEAGDAMRNYFDETTLTMNRVKDKDAPGLMWALTEEYVSGATPILTDWDRARAALPKDGAA